jgi:ABC-type Na+ efflux pump permease subunit
LLRSLIWIVEKELRYALRDTDVLIYGVLTPLLIYPTVIVGLSEAITWTASRTETIKCFANIEQWPPHLKQRIEEDKTIKLVASASPMKDLQEKKVDLVASFKEAENKYVFDMYSRTRLNLDRLKGELAAAQYAKEEATYAAHRVPADVMKIYNIESERLLPAIKGEAQVEKHFPLLALLIASMGIVQGILTAAVSATCLLVEEREKNTFETMVTAPVPLTLLVLGKWVASTLLSVISGAIMTLSLAISFVGLFLLNVSIKRFGTAMLDTLLYVDWSLPLAFVAVVIGSAFAAGVFMVCCATAKTFKEGQAIATYPVTVLGILPALGLIPGIESSAWILFCPLLNITATLKHSQNEVNIILALLITLAWAIACCFLAGKIFLSEKGLLAISTKGPRAGDLGDTV